MELRPLQDRVVIKRVEEETKTASGIIIPDTHKEKPTQGEVVAIGSGYALPDGKIRPLEVKKGDKVLIHKHSGMEIKLDGKEYTILKESEILGILQ